MENIKPTETDSVETLLNTGAEAMERKDYDLAVSSYEQAAEMGSSAALARLGDIYNEGFARPRDTDKAFAYYKQAADAGNADGMYGLGICYDGGYSVKADGEKAVEWYEKAAAHGNSNAMIKLGHTYCAPYDDFDDEDGDENPPHEKNGQKRIYIGNAYLYRNNDIGKAEEWYRKAIEAGNARGTHALVSMYNRIAFEAENTASEAIRTASDAIKTVIEYCTKAADLGDAEAMEPLSWLRDELEELLEEVDVAESNREN